MKKKKKFKLHALPTVRAEAEPLVRLTTGRPGHLNPLTAIDAIMRHFDLCSKR